jgi:TolB-like protein/tetratricopeptide (TPR) repeat protein
LFILVAGSVYLTRTKHGSQLQGRKVMLAVLPVQNLSGDPGRNYLTDGLTDEMIALLGSLNPTQLGVIARTSAMALKQTTKTADQIGRELGADYILQTTLGGTGNHLRLRARLIRTKDRVEVWSQDYDRSISDIVAVQDEFSRAVADKIRGGLLPLPSVRIGTPGQMNADAYQDYLRGRFFWNQRTQEGFLKSRNFFEQAIEKDPSHPLGYAGLADAYLGLSDYDVLPAREAVPRSKAAARKAIELDGTIAEAHAALASALCEFDWDVAAAEKEFKRAIALNPSYATAHQWYGECMLWIGKITEAKLELSRAKELDPLSPIITRNEGLPLFIGRRYDEYLAFCRHALEVDPTFWPNHFSLAWAYELTKDLSHAVAEYEVADQLSESSLTLAHLAHAYALAGRRSDAEKLLVKITAQAKQRYVPAVHFAFVYEGLGDRDNALKWLQKAYDDRYWWMIELKTDPRWDSLRSDRRFQDLVLRVGLPE